jgi:hypothetical protein
MLGVQGAEFLELLSRLIVFEAAKRCLGRICAPLALDDIFYGQVTNTEALAFFVYSTANGWHSYINEQLWSGHPEADVVAFARVLNAGLAKIIPIRGKQATVYRGYHAADLTGFDAHYSPGSIVVFPAFTSASFSETGAFGGNVLFIIRALSGRAIWWLSPNFHEEEALLPTGCRFRVIDKQFQQVGNEPSKLVIVLQEIDQRP